MISEKILVDEEFWINTRNGSVLIVAGNDWRMYDDLWFMMAMYHSSEQLETSAFTAH